jgi:hypothetical protein
MKKRVLILAATVALLTLVLTAPASATPPADVSGGFGICYFTDPIGREAGGNCIVEQAGRCWMYGDLQGWESQQFTMVSHGPCPPAGPGVYNDNGR